MRETPAVATCTRRAGQAAGATASHTDTDTTTWTTIAALPAEGSDPQLPEAGATLPQTEVTVTDSALHLVTLGPARDELEARRSAAGARALAADLLSAARALEAAA